MSFDINNLISIYGSTRNYMCKSPDFIIVLYKIMLSLSDTDFNEFHLRFLKADGYESLISAVLPFVRIIGQKYDLISNFPDKEKISVKTQDTIFQMKEQKNGKDKKDNNGNIMFSEPKDIAVLNSLGAKPTDLVPCFDFLLAIQPETIENNVIVKPFAIAVASSEKIGQTGRWEGDQFRVKMYNHNMKKRDGRKKDMINCILHEQYDFYRELDPKESRVNKKYLTKPNGYVNSQLKILFDNLYIG